MREELSSFAFPNTINCRQPSKLEQEAETAIISFDIPGFTNLTNSFSKKLENHEAAIALLFMYYNFCCIHQTLCIPPAMAAKVSDHVWEIEEVVALLEFEEKAAIEASELKRGKYRPRNSN